MSISSVHFLDASGKPLISRSYRDCPQPEIMDKFMVVLSEKEEDKSIAPVFQIDDISFAFLKERNIYLVATASGNANIAMIFEFMRKLIQLMRDYFKEVEEESIKDNFVLIHELLDEMVDFGYPQITESQILMEYVTQESKKLESKVRIPPAVTNAVSWRSEGIRYKKNELFLDIVESINLTANANGTVVSSEILGSVRIKCCLSGMPELLLGLNDRLLCEKNESEIESCVDLAEVKFHQCVRLSKFDNDRVISFIPPDGVFELMSYRLNTYVKPPIWVSCVSEHFKNRKIEYTVRVTSNFKNRFTAAYVDIFIPVPPYVDSPVFKVLGGTPSYVPGLDMIKWSFKSMPGCREYLMTAKFGLPSVALEEEEPTGVLSVLVGFQISLYTVSGIKVQYLRVSERGGYTALPWVRYVTQNGNYQIRRREVLHTYRQHCSKLKLS